MLRASDDFNRANVSPLASPWAAAVGDGGTLKIVSNKVTQVTVDSNNDGAIYTGITWPGDQWSEARFTTTSTGGGRQGPCLHVRYALAANTNYRLSVDHAASTNCNISRFVAGTRTTILDFTQAWTDGAIWMLAVDGPASAARLRVYLNGTLIQTVTDSSGIATGYPGIGVSDNDVIATIDDWRGGDFIQPANTRRRVAALMASRRRK